MPNRKEESSSHTRESQPSDLRPEMVSNILTNLQRNGSLMTYKGFRYRMLPTVTPLGKESSLDPDGNPVYSFRQKFAAGFGGWQPDQRVRSQFFALARTEGKIIQLAVAKSVVDDNIDQADYFTLEGLGKKDFDALSELTLAQIDANVEVISKGKHVTMNMYDYKARLVHINGVQELYNGDPSTLKKGQMVLVQGKVDGYDVNHISAYDANLKLILNNDRTVNIKLSNGYITLKKKGVFNDDPNYPVKGDTVQVQTQLYHPEPKFLIAPHDSTRLLKPSNERA